MKGMRETTRNHWCWLTEGEPQRVQGSRGPQKKKAKVFFPPSIQNKSLVLTGLPRRYTRSEGKGEREVSPFGFYRQSSADRGPHRTFRSVVSTLSLSLARALCQPENQQPDKNKKNSSSFRFLKSKSQWLCKPKRIIVFDSKVPHIENNWIASLHNQDRLIHVRVFFYFPRPSRGKMLYFFNWWPIMLSSSCARVSSMWQTLKTNARLCRVGSCATDSSCDSPFPCWPDTCDTLGGNDLDLYPHSHLSPPPLNKVSLFRQVFC